MDDRPDKIPRIDKTGSKVGAKIEALSSSHSTGALPLTPASQAILKDLNRRFLEAAEKGKLAEVQSLLEQGAEINTKDDPDGRTALHLAARKDHVEVVQELLLRHNPDVNIQDQCKGLTPLAIAATHGFQGVLDALLEHHAIDLTKDKDNQRTPLHLAARWNKIGVIKALLKHGKLDVDAKDRFNFTPLHLAARLGYNEIVQDLLNVPANVNAEDEDRRTPLHLAVRANREEVVKTILKDGRVKVSLKDKWELTPLHLAAREGYDEIVRDLLRQRASIGVANDDGNSPLHLAARNGLSATVKILLDQNLLLDQEPEVDIRNKAAETPLHCIAKNTTKSDVEVKDIVTTLLKRGADINAKDKAKGEDDETPLHLAARSGSRAAVEALLDFNNPLSVTDGGSPPLNSSRPTADVNMENTVNYTPFSIAIRHGWTEIVGLMLGRADLSRKGPMTHVKGTVTTLENALRNGNDGIVKLLLDPKLATFKEIDTPWNSDLGCTPLTWAVREGKEELTRILLERGAKINLQDKDLMSPLQMASRSGHKKIVEHLLGCDPKPKVDLKGGEDDWTALHFASFAGKDEIVRLLLAGNADPLLRTRRSEASGGDTPLSLAASNFHTKSVEVLLNCLRDKLQNSAVSDAQKLVVGYLGLEKDGRGVLYSYETMRSAAEHEETHELVRLVLKQRCSLDPRSRDNSDNERSRESFISWEEEFRNFRSQIGQLMGPKNDKEKESWNVLQWAVYHEELELIEKLLLSSNNKDEKARDLEKKKKASAEDLAWKICEKIHKKKAAEESLPDQSQEGQTDHDPANDRSKETGKSMEELQHMSFSEDHGIVRSRRQSTASAASVEDDNSEPSITTKKEYLDNLGTMEDNYLNLRDSLRYGIPLNPSVVKVASMNKPTETPKLDIDKSKIDEFFAGIIDIYNDGDGVAFLRRSRRVENVIYDPGPKAIMEKAREPAKNSKATHKDVLIGNVQETDHKKDDLRLRWVHLPANNMKWMEDLNSRILLDTKPGSGAHVEPNINLDSRDFLRQSWHELPKGNSKVHFMKPTCVKQFTKTESEIAEPSSAKSKKESKSRSEFSKKEDKEGKETKKAKEKTETKPAKESKSIIDKTKSAKEDKMNQGKTVEPKGAFGIPDALALYMPYFTFSTLTDKEYAPSRVPKGPKGDENPNSKQEGSAPVQHHVHPNKGAVISNQPMPNLLQEELTPIAEARTYQSLLETYGGDKRSILHGSRTLDEFFYHSVSNFEAQEDMKTRNNDQVTSKRVMHVAGKGEWTIIRVDQLWLWIVDNKTIISSSTHRMDQMNDPILEGIWKYMNSDEVQNGRASIPSSPYEMAKFITEFCIDIFDHSTCAVGDVEESMHEIYKNSINQTTIHEALLFETFAGKINDIITALETSKAPSDIDLEIQAKKLVKENFNSIKEASALLKEIKDIRDELNMLKAVLTQQKSVWNELHGLQAEKNNLRGPGYAINNIKEMDEQAERVQNAVLSVLDLEQNEASIQEAMASREQAQESIKQGRTLMVFTIVTIIFLPGSFLASIFALNISVFPHQGDSVYWPNWAFAIIFPLTIALSLIIVGFAFYVDDSKKLVKKLEEKYRDWKVKHDKAKKAEQERNKKKKPDGPAGGTVPSNLPASGSNLGATKVPPGPITPNSTNTSHSRLGLFNRGGKSVQGTNGPNNV